jgi:hypothetical protein
LGYIAAHKAVYLTELVCFVGLSVPALAVFVAVAVALKDVDKSTAILGGVIGVASEIIALSLGSSPQSLHGGLVLLSDSYAAAGTDAERAGLVSAAEALIAATNAVSWAGILTAAGILVLSALMGRSDFGRVLAAVGVFTGAICILSEALRPMIGSAYLFYGCCYRVVRAGGTQASPIRPTESAMTWTRGGLEIARPVEEVFDTVADQRNEPRHDPRMTSSTKLSEGPIGVGIRFRGNRAHPWRTRARHG